MAQLYSNNASSTLGTGISSAATSMTVATGEGSKFPNPSGGDFFLLTLYQKTGATEANWEIVKCTARNTDTLTIIRNQEGSTPKAFNAGDPVELRLTAGSMNSDGFTEGATNKYFTASRVLSTALTGLSLVAGQVVSATDTVLQAIGYLQKQITDLATSKLNAVNGVLTGESYAHVDKGTANTGTVTFDYRDGDSQQLQIGGALTLSASNWPAAGRRAFLMIELINAGSAVVTISPTINWVKPDGSKTTSLATYMASIVRPTLQTSGTDFMIWWTRDGGVTIYGKIL